MFDDLVAAAKSSEILLNIKLCLIFMAELNKTNSEFWPTNNSTGDTWPNAIPAKCS